MQPTPEPEAFNLPLVLGTGRVTVEDWENWLLGDAVGAHPSYDVVHPGLLTVLTTRGTAVPISKVLEIINCRLEDGPMVASQALEMNRPLRVGATYTIKSSITEIVRKNGRRSGPFDLVTYVVSLEEHDQVVASVANRIFVPRRGA